MAQENVWVKICVSTCPIFAAPVHIYWSMYDPLTHRGFLLATFEGAWITLPSTKKNKLGHQNHLEYER